MHRFSSLLRRFGRDESGVFAVIFGLMAIVLVALSGAVVDYVSLEQTRNRSQIALDAAALALHPEILKTNPDKAAIQLAAQNLVNDSVGVGLVGIENTTINKTEGTLYFDAKMTVNTAFVSLVGVPKLSARIQSEVTRGSLDIEVAVAVDITGSMNDRVPKAGSGGQTETKIESLRSALGELIELVVQDEQKPSHSKMAIVPYSMGVNVGGYADALRGPVKMPTAITAIAWSTGSAKTITDATRANPVVITSNGHGFSDGDTVYISGVSGMTDLNNRIYTVSGKTDDTFKLSGVNGSSYKQHSNSTGRVTKCLVNACELVVQSPGHGLASNSQVHIYGVGGMPSYSGTGSYDRYNQYPSEDNTSYNWINNNRLNYTGTNADARDQYKFLVWDIGAANTDTFVLKGTTRTNRKNYGTYTSGGSAACVTAGCQYYLYQNRYNRAVDWRIQQISTCVTERTTDTYTDKPTSTSPMGRNYPTKANPCPDVGIQPLTADKDALHDLAEDLPAVGSTAGHIGVAMAWNMVSPNFDGPWTANLPAPKTNKNVLRAVVLMTDGAFNTSYCNGVISRQSGSGSGEELNKINCDSPNGDDSFDQALELCAAMKAADPSIRIYTVAFDVGNIANAQAVMNNCASEPAFAFKANSGDDLKKVFNEIGKHLAFLRVTR